MELFKWETPAEWEDSAKLFLCSCQSLKLHHCKQYIGKSFRTLDCGREEMGIRDE